MKKGYLKYMLLCLTGIGLLIPAGLVYRHYRADTAQAHQRISSRGRVIDTACGPIEYSDSGEGAPVLIIHGAGGGYDQGEFIANTLGGNFHWITPSRFGYLKSPIPANADARKQAELYACLLDALKIERAAVLAYSMGGPSALQFALHYPERTTSLIMASALSHPVASDPSLYSNIRGWVFQAFLDDFVYWSLVHTNKEMLFTFLGMPTSNLHSLSPEMQTKTGAFLEDILPMSARRNGLIFDMAHLTDYDADWALQLHRIQAPTLVLHARNDSLVVFEQGEFTAQNVPGAQFLLLDQGGHGTVVFYPETTAKVVDFLKQHNP